MIFMPNPKRKEKCKHREMELNRHDKFNHLQVNQPFSLIITIRIYFHINKAL